MGRLHALLTATSAAETVFEKGALLTPRSTARRPSSSALHRPSPLPSFAVAWLGPSCSVRRLQDARIKVLGGAVAEARAQVAGAVAAAAARGGRAAVAADTMTPDSRPVAPAATFGEVGDGQQALLDWYRIPSLTSMSMSMSACMTDTGVDAHFQPSVLLHRPSISNQSRRVIMTQQRLCPRH